MDNIVGRFFKELSGSQPQVPAPLTGTLRFDLENGKELEHWFVTFDKGSAAISESDAEAECVVRTDKATFASIVEGRMNAMAAVLRGAIFIDGRILLLAAFRMLLPPPAAVPSGIKEGGYARRQS